MSQKPHIAIIGAGFTGLTAAYRLSRLGYAVTVYEKGATPGGLVASTTIEGEPIEQGYHHIFRTDKALIELMKELGIADRLEWLPSTVGVYDKNGLYAFGSATDLLRYPLLSLWQRFRMGLGYLYLRYLADPGSLERYPASSYMRRLFGRTVYRHMWEPLLRAKFHQYAHGVNMAWLWARLDTRARSQQGGREVLGYPKGGFRIITDALVDRLTQQGVALHTSTTVEALIPNADGSWKLQANGHEHTYQAVLASVPNHVLPQMVQADWDDLYKTQLKAIPYLGAVIVLFSSPQKLSNYYWHNVHDTHAPFVSMLQHTNLVTDGRYGGQHVYYMGAYRPHEDEQFWMEEKELVALYLDYLKQMFPHFDIAQVRDCQVHRLPNAQHVPLLRYRRLMPDVQTPFDRLWLCNFSQIFPQDRGTNHAVHAANEVVADIHARLGLTASAGTPVSS